MNKKFSVGKIVGFGLLAVAFIMLLSAVVMYLWNHVLVVVLGVTVVSFWQAAGILLLSKILFGGFKGGWAGKCCCGNSMKDRCKTLTPEEKEQFKQEWKNRCRSWGNNKANNVDNQSV